VTWSGALTVIDARLVTAGAGLAAPITAVRQGEPDAVTTRTLAYWYGGDRPEDGANTLGQTTVEELIVIRGYFPGSIRALSQDATVEIQLQAAKAAVRAALWGGFTLGGNCIGLDLDPTETGWTVVGDALCRMFEIKAWIDLGQVETIAP
jgi:hypothetical protein